MSIEIVGGVLSAPVAGDTADDRRAASFMPDPRAREVDPAFVAWQARQDEADGYDRSLVHTYSSWADPWLIAGAAAQATERLGVTVAHRPGTTAPTVAARAFATLDRLSGGRASVHIVIGSSDVDVLRDGDAASKPERYRRAGEYLTLFRRALTAEEPFDFSGEFYRVTDAWSGFRPAQLPHPPLSIGGSSPEAKRLAAEHATVYAGSYASPEAAAAVVAEVGALAHEHSRRLGFWKHFVVVLGETDAEARDTVRSLEAHALGLLARRSDDTIRASAQFQQASERGAGAAELRAAAAGHVSAMFGGLLVGSVETVASVIDGYRRAGIDVLNVVALTETGDDRALRRRLVAELRRAAPDGGAL